MQSGEETKQEAEESKESGPRNRVTLSNKSKS